MAQYGEVQRPRLVVMELDWPRDVPVVLVTNAEADALEEAHGVEIPEARWRFRDAR